MKIEANLNNVKDIENLPIGVYNVCIMQEPKFVVSSQKKTPGLEFEYTFMDPGTELAPGVPRTMRDTIYRSEKFGWEHFRIKEVCEAAGVALENPDTADFVSVALKLAINQEPYEDKHKTPKVRNIIDHFLKA